MTETLTGTNRSAGVSLDRLLDCDTHPVSDALPNAIDGSINAYRNACLHRGRKLRTCDSKGAKKLDGSVREIPCQRDFPDIDITDYGLAVAKVGTWQGFVFIDPDRDAGPHDEFLGDLADHFTVVLVTRRYKGALAIRPRS